MDAQVEAKRGHLLSVMTSKTRIIILVIVALYSCVARGEVKSLIINRPDSTDMRVNLSEDMRITFEDNFIHVIDWKLCLEIPIDEITSWYFSDERFDVMVNVEEVRTESLFLERTPSGLLVRNDEEDIELRVYNLSGMLVKHYPPARSIEMLFCDYKKGIYLVDMGCKTIKIIIQ